MKQTDKTPTFYLSSSLLTSSIATSQRQRPRLKRLCCFSHHTTGLPSGQHLAYNNLALGNLLDQHVPLVAFHTFQPPTVTELLPSGSLPGTPSCTNVAGVPCALQVSILRTQHMAGAH